MGITIEQNASGTAICQKTEILQVLLLASVVVKVYVDVVSSSRAAALDGNLLCMVMVVLFVQVFEMSGFPTIFIPKNDCINELA